MKVFCLVNLFGFVPQKALKIMYEIIIYEIVQVV